MAFKAGVIVTKDNVPAFKKAVKALTSHEVLVGIPSDETEREAEETGKTIKVKGQQGRKDIVIQQVKKPDITNAEIGYISEFGAPEMNIPARSFLIPGIRNGMNRYREYLRQGAEYAFNGNIDGVMRAMEAIGMVARDSVKQKITDGPFQPLAPRTLEARAKKGRVGAAEELNRRAQGLPASTEFAKPLIDTGQLRASINYVVRKIKRRRNAVS